MTEREEAIVRRCIEICEEAEVLIPIEVWTGTKKGLSAATAMGLGALIRKEFGIESQKS